MHNPPSEMNSPHARLHVYLTRKESAVLGDRVVHEDVDSIHRLPTDLFRLFAYDDRNEVKNQSNTQEPESKMMNALGMKQGRTVEERIVRLEEMRRINVQHAIRTGFTICATLEKWY